LGGRAGRMMVTIGGAGGGVWAHAAREINAINETLVSIGYLPTLNANLPLRGLDRLRFHAVPPPDQPDGISHVVAGQQPENSQGQRVVAEIGPTRLRGRIQRIGKHDPVDHPSHEQHRQGDADVRVRRVEESLRRGFEPRLAQAVDSQQDTADGAPGQRAERCQFTASRHAQNDEEQREDGDRDPGTASGQRLPSDRPFHAAVHPPDQQRNHDQERQVGRRWVHRVAILVEYGPRPRKDGQGAMRMNHREALVMCLLSCALLGGCDAEFRQPGFNPDSTYRDPDEEFKKREEAFNRPASPPPPPARLHPLTKVLNAYPKDDYEVAVLYMYEIMHTPDATQAICARWFPDYGRQTADAVNAWQKKNEPLMKEISDRTHAIWIGQADGDASVVPWAEGRFNRDRRQQYDNNFDKT